MRLSTERDRDDDRGLAVIASALDAGIELLDTADVYAHDDADLGHNERLIARLARPATIVTKGGLTRPDGAWVPDGRARHLAAAARASRERLGRPIDLYLLHVVDPRVELATSARALAKLRADGVVRAVGLSNVNLAQLEAALAITEIAAVEVELSPWKLDALRGGLVAACVAHGIRVLAHRPLGGPAGARRLARDPIVRAIAERHAATACEVALAWLASLAPVIVPLPGATTVATARSIGRAADLALDDDARAELARRFVAIGDGPVGAGGADVVAIAGMPGSGKSTLAAARVACGAVRLNRDERGGTLRGIAEALDRALAEGARHVVLDNTYATRASRAEVIEVAHRHGATARCLVMQTSLEDAQRNAAARMLAQHGRLLEPDEIRADPTAIGPSALFRFRRGYEPPRADEGWDAIEDIAFVRATTGTHAGTIVELDRLVWIGRPRVASGVRLAEGARDRLAARPHVAGTTWLPGLDRAGVDAVVARLRELLGFALPVAACTHLPGPPVCWCRKPLPGLGLVLARDADLDLARSTHLGRGPADAGFAARLGMRFEEF